MTNRIQISAVITGNHAAIAIIRQKDRGPRITETYHATVNGREFIEIENEYDVGLSEQTLIRKVIREAMK